MVLICISLMASHVEMTHALLKETTTVCVTHAHASSVPRACSAASRAPGENRGHANLQAGDVVKVGLGSGKEQGPTEQGEEDQLKHV